MDLLTSRNTRHEKTNTKWHVVVVMAVMASLTGSFASENPPSVVVNTDEATAAARESRENSQVEFLADDVARHVDYLCGDELAGRMTGTAGEKLATAYAAASRAAVPSARTLLDWLPRISINQTCAIISASIPRYATGATTSQPM